MQAKFDNIKLSPGTDKKNNCVVHVDRIVATTKWVAIQNTNL